MLCGDDELSIFLSESAELFEALLSMRQKEQSRLPFLSF
jgi:hypothetical protein